MRYLFSDSWSHRSSLVHSLDTRVKLAGLLLIEISISLSPLVILPLIAAALIAIASASRLPVTRLLQRAALVLPFGVLLAIAAWFSGDLSRGGTLLTKSYLSALATIVFASTTPLPAWTAALHSWRVPPALISTIQFLYRYLFVIADEVQTMSTAARARGGLRFTAAVGTLAVLFLRSWQRAESVHRAMLARGYRS